MNVVRQLLTCHWSARRIQRYLDADPTHPVGLLTPGEVARLEEHLAQCERCAAVITQHRGLRRVLATWAAPPAADPGSVDRLHTFLDELSEEPNR